MWKWIGHADMRKAHGKSGLTNVNAIIWHRILCQIDEEIQDHNSDVSRRGKDAAGGPKIVSSWIQPFRTQVIE